MNILVSFRVIFICYFFQHTPVMCHFCYKWCIVFFVPLFFKKTYLKQEGHGYSLSLTWVILNTNVIPHKTVLTGIHKNSSVSSRSNCFSWLKPVDMFNWWKIKIQLYVPSLVTEVYLVVTIPPFYLENVPKLLET